MKSVMKKLFSLLLVVVITVSMFGFVAPPSVEAAEANASRDKIIITSFVKHAEKIKVETGVHSGYSKKSFEISPPKGLLSNQCSFKTEFYSIRVRFCIYEPSNPKTKRLISAEFWKSDLAIYGEIVRDPDKSIFIEIDRNAKVTASTFNGWHLTSFTNKII